ncbi:MAG: hypothetical protein AAF512_01840 [Pseudomonadota bacterium]
MQAHTQGIYSPPAEYLTQSIGEQIAAEHDELQSLENKIASALKSFETAGKALAEIRERGLYQAQYITFENYCHSKWDISPNYARKLIDAARVVENLRPITVCYLPANEAQARLLTPFPPEQQRQLWQRIINACLDEYCVPRITAEKIKTVINGGDTQRAKQAKRASLQEKYEWMENYIKTLEAQIERYRETYGLLNEA